MAGSLFEAVLGLSELDDEEDDEGAWPLGCAGAADELLELEPGLESARGDWGAMVTEVDDEDGGWLLGALGVLVELLELDGLESARGEGWVVDDEDDDWPGAPGGPGGPCRSQPASAKAPALNATRSLIVGFFMSDLLSLSTGANPPPAGNGLARCRCR